LTNLEQINNSTNGIPRLGHLFWFEVGDISQSWDLSKEILERNGFDPDSLPITNAKRAFFLGLKYVREVMVKENINFIVRPLPDKGDFVRRQVTMEKLEENGEELEYEKELIVHFEKSSGKISFEKSQDWDSMDESFKNKLIGRMRRFQNRISKKVLLDWTAYEWKRWNAISVRSTGGVWFVPEVSTGAVERVKKVYEDFGEGSKFYASPVLDVEEGDLSKEDLAGFVDRDFDTEIRWFNSQLDDMIEVASLNGGEIKEKALDTKIASYDRIVSKAEMYEKILGYTAKRIRRSCEEATDKIKSIQSGSVEGLVPTKPKAEIREEERALKKKEKEDLKAEVEKGKQDRIEAESAINFPDLPIGNQFKFLELFDSAGVQMSGVKVTKTLYNLAEYYKDKKRKKARPEDRVIDLGFDDPVHIVDLKEKPIIDSLPPDEDQPQELPNCPF